MVLVAVLIFCAALLAVAILVTAMIIKSPGLVFFAVLIAAITLIVFTRQILEYLHNVLP